MTHAFSFFLNGFLHRLYPPHAEVALAAVRALQPQHYPTLATAAGLGALAASAVLYGIGACLRRLPSAVSTEAQQMRIETMRKPARDWLPWLLILSPTQFGGILILAAGFFGIAPARAAAMIALAEIAWRASPML